MSSAMIDQSMFNEQLWMIDDDVRKLTTMPVWFDLSKNQKFNELLQMITTIIKMRNERVKKNVG